MQNIVEPPYQTVLLHLVQISMCICNIPIYSNIISNIVAWTKLKQNKFYISYWDDYTNNNIWCMKWNADMSFLRK